MKELCDGNIEISRRNENRETEDGDTAGYEMMGEDGKERTEIRNEKVRWRKGEKAGGIKIVPGGKR